VHKPLPIFKIKKKAALLLRQPLFKVVKLSFKSYNTFRGEDFYQTVQNFQINN
jgi:hypothetical protein